MSTFTALNLEQEDTIEQEADDSREIQIEEALKLYQNALKLHSQGPDYVADAAAAYEELFKSEVFRYPEAASEFVKHDLGEKDLDQAQISQDVASLIPTSAVDASPNSLLQIIYLAYKNYGQFILDSLKYGPLSKTAGSALDTKAALKEAGAGALQNFAQALERDDSDLDLWRKTARVGGVVPSRRLVRFCLESVLATDEENSYEVSDLLGLDELSAFEDLKSELKVLADDLSAYQVPNIQPKNTIVSALKIRLDPYPFLPKPQSQLEHTGNDLIQSSFVPQRKLLQVSSRTWTAVGTAIYRSLVEFENGNLEPGVSLGIEVPPNALVEDEKDQEMDLDPTSNGHPESTTQSPELQAKQEHIVDQVEEHHSDVPDGSPLGQNSNGTPDDVGDQLRQQLSNDIAETLENGEHTTEAVIEEGAAEVPSINLPSRKRSSLAAGNDDTTESGRVKSKRLRARESIVDNLQEEEVAADLSGYYEDRFMELSQLDDVVFTTIEQSLELLQVHEMPHLRRFRQSHSNGANVAFTRSPDDSPMLTAMFDMQVALSSWSDESGQALLIGDGTSDLDNVGSSKNVGLALFQEHTKPAVLQTASNVDYVEDQGLDHFLHQVNNGWDHPHTTASQWVEALLVPAADSSSKDNHGGPMLSMYTGPRWSPALKELVVKVIISQDEYLLELMETRLMDLEERLLKGQGDNIYNLTDAEVGYVHMTESMFELHLDVYCAITNPSSVVDKHTRIKQKDRLHRWNELASSYMNQYSKSIAVDLADGLVLRFLFASTLHAIRSDEMAQDHVMLCLKDLQTLLQEADDTAISLPNNAAMPEISVAAMSQEMSRLSTLDFFMAMFSSDESDPVTVIESLEPILEYSAGASRSPQDEIGEDDNDTLEATPSLSAQALELVSFLRQGNASLTLYLWRRLRDAYRSIDYPPKVVSCYLRSFQVVMKELTSQAHLEKPDGQRHLSLLKWLKHLDDIMVKLMGLVLHSSTAFDCIDSNHLQDSLTSVCHLAFILHSFATYDDGIRVGVHHGPRLKSASSNKSFEKVKDKLREMQMRLWTLLYVLLRDGMAQYQERFPNETESRSDYLRFVHIAMGLRGYCKYSNKVFLKLMKQEFITMKSWQEYETDFAQVLFDLYGLKFGPGIGDWDHGCSSETLDKKTANQIIGFVMSQANRVNPKDIAKGDIRMTLEKMQFVMGTYKTTPTLSFNKRVINHFLKSPINPTELYGCLKGIGDLPTKPVRTDSALVADMGWYYLQGHLALARFKSIKRVNPTSTDDLDVAAAFFRQDLDHNIEKWETWYRLAQVYDCKIEDDLLWTAEKINNHRGELATLQRNAIHCYSMAVAASLRTAEMKPESAATMSDMLTEFAIRLYASSREPMSMQAFSLENWDRHYSSEVTGTMYKAKPFGEMKSYAIWTLAAHLLRRAIVDKPKKWINYYYLSKCLWKMLHNTGDPRSIRSKPGVDELLEVLVEAVDTLPEKKDSRADPILEPHFKLISIVHKLVRNRMLDPARGSGVLQVSKWARKAHLSEEEDGWEQYVLQILKFLGQADKSNWHHRIPARAAHVIYDENEKDLAAALGAKHELTQQIFTKTMTIQVWKPDNERPGRHFVYTTRYVSFFIGILYQLNDRGNLDMLARRIRRKPGDYLNHGKLWEAVCSTYIQLLRKLGKLQLGLDETVFGTLNTEDFLKRASKVETWAQDSKTSSPTIEILRDALELKKLNNSLMKGSAFDDLIADAYTKVYETYYQEHPDTESDGIPQMKLLSSVGGILSQTDGTLESSPYATPPSLTANLSQASVEGVSNGPANSGASSAPAKPIRNKPVSRREIIRRAEAIVSRAAQVQTNTTPKPSTATPAKTLRPVIEIRTSTPSATSPVLQSATQASTSKSLPPHILGSAATNRNESSAPGSPTQPIKDADETEDADDEQAGNDSGSELSDLDEDEANELERKAKVLFPGLMAVRERKDSTSSGGSNEEQGDNQHDNPADGGLEDDPDATDVDNEAGEDEDEVEDEEGVEDQQESDDDNTIDEDEGEGVDETGDRDEVMADVEKVLG